MMILEDNEKMIGTCTALLDLAAELEEGKCDAAAAQCRELALGLTGLWIKWAECNSLMRGSQPGGYRVVADAIEELGGKEERDG